MVTRLPGDVSERMAPSSVNDERDRDATGRNATAATAAEPAGAAAQGAAISTAALLEQLQAAATQLARAALSLGVVEWSSQALASVVKLHAATWLVGGALQAFSAAYLTRVVGRAMADYLALAAGVPEAELEALLQRQAPLLVARAAEEERIDWSGFLQQGRQWLVERQRQLPAETSARGGAGEAGQMLP